MATEFSTTIVPFSEGERYFGSSLKRIPKLIKKGEIPEPSEHGWTGKQIMDWMQATLAAQGEREASATRCTKIRVYGRTKTSLWKLRAALRKGLAEYVNDACAGLSCSICGAEQFLRGNIPNIILHHPEQDGRLRNVHILSQALASTKEIDAEIARCEPLCNSCHTREHGRIKAERRSGRRMNGLQIIEYHRAFRAATANSVAAKARRRAAQAASNPECHL